MTHFTPSQSAQNSILDCSIVRLRLYHSRCPSAARCTVARRPTSGSMYVSLKLISWLSLAVLNNSRRMQQAATSSSIRLVLQLVNGKVASFMRHQIPLSISIFTSVLRCNSSEKIRVWQDNVAIEWMRASKTRTGASQHTPVAQVDGGCQTVAKDGLKFRYGRVKNVYHCLVRIISARKGGGGNRPHPHGKCKNNLFFYEYVSFNCVKQLKLINGNSCVLN